MVLEPHGLQGRWRGYPLVAVVVLTCAGSPDNLRQSIASITTKLFGLPDDTLVHPGHGDGGSTGQSKRAYAVYASKQHPADLCGNVTWEGS